MCYDSLQDIIQVQANKALFTVQIIDIYFGIKSDTVLLNLIHKVQLYCSVLNLIQTRPVI